MNLIPLSEYVELQLNTKQSTSEFKEAVKNYTKFLRQPLTLGMFVPVDDQGNELKHRPRFNDYSSLVAYRGDVLEYDNACEKVIFEGFGLHSINSAFNADMGLTIDLDTFQFMIEDSLGVGGGDIWGKTLEALAYTDLQLPLTPSALKLIGEKE